MPRKTKKLDAQTKTNREISALIGRHLSNESQVELVKRLYRGLPDVNLEFVKVILGGIAEAKGFDWWNEVFKK